MPIPIVTLSEYIQKPKMLATNLTNIMEYLAVHFPEVIAYTDTDAPLSPPDCMDRYYTSWIRKEKRGTHIKRRHISMVTSWELREAHVLLNRQFQLPSLDCVYSYKEGKRTAHCAEMHVGRFALYKLDIRDYFPSITRPMIEAAYLGYFKTFRTALKEHGKRNRIAKKTMERASRVFAIIATRSDTRFLSTDTAVLPIGIVPASTISNHILLPIDTELSLLAERYGLVYSRYSDNLFFSTNAADMHIERGIQEEIRNSIENYECEGKYPFRINRKKTQYAPRWRHQRVLGIVVNARLNIPRSTEKWLRSALNHLYYEVRELHTHIVRRDLPSLTLQTSFRNIYRKTQRVCGELSYISSVTPDKYLKYSAAQYSIRLLVEECKLELQLLAEDADTTRGAGGAV